MHILRLPSKRPSRVKLLRLFRKAPKAIIHVACGDKSGSFYGGRLIHIDENQMFIRNWRGRKENVPKKLGFIHFEVKPPGTPPMVLGGPRTVVKALQAIAA